MVVVLSLAFAGIAAASAPNSARTSKASARADHVRMRLPSAWAAHAAPGVNASSGSAMPVGNLPGWTQVFAEDFSTAVPLGGFEDSSYASKWWDYNFPDNTGSGVYDAAKTLSVHDGVLDMWLHTAGGHALTGAIGHSNPSQTYGRYSVRFRADSMPGYAAAFLLWPDSNNWNEGEIDFAEGAFDSSIMMFDHCVGAPRDNCSYHLPGVSWTGWHTATTEWVPGHVNFYLDDTLIGTGPSSPTTPMHMVLQTEATGNPAPSVSGHVLIDWVSIWAKS